MKALEPEALKYRLSLPDSRREPCDALQANGKGAAEVRATVRAPAGAPVKRRGFLGALLAAPAALIGLARPKRLTDAGGPALKLQHLYDQTEPIVFSGGRASAWATGDCSFLKKGDTFTIEGVYADNWKPDIDERTLNWHPERLA